MRRVAGVILAAGNASRFGEPKQLAIFRGEKLIDLAANTIANSVVDDIGIVLGCYESEIRSHLEEAAHARPLDLILNAQWKEGIASSIRAAIKFARSKNSTHVLVMTCDQPFVTVNLLNQLCQSADDERISASSYGESLGIPAVFPQKYFSQLASLSGDRGAKSIIKKSRSPLAIDFPQGKMDVDTKNLLEEYSN